MFLVTRFVCICLLIGALIVPGFSQERDSTSLNSPLNSLKICNVRPTFFEFSVRSLPAINHYPVNNSNHVSDYGTNRLFNVKLNLPIILSRKLNVIGQFRYKNERLNLGEDLGMEEKNVHFDNVGMSILLKYDINERYFIAGHMGSFFKADNVTFERYGSILDFNSSVLLGKNVSNGTIGIGGVFGNSMGRLRIYPLILTDLQLSNRWKLEMKLPKEIQVRRIIKEDNFYLTAGAEVNAASYFISQDIFEGIENLEYRRAAVDLRIGLEKEIYDFLWMSFETGLTQPIYSALVQTGRPTTDKLFDFGHSFSPYGSLSVYIVPPRSLFNRKLK